MDRNGFHGRSFAHAAGRLGRTRLRIEDIKIELFYLISNDFFSLFHILFQKIYFKVKISNENYLHLVRECHFVRNWSFVRKVPEIREVGYLDFRPWFWLILSDVAEKNWRQEAWEHNYQGRQSTLHSVHGDSVYILTALLTALIMGSRPNMTESKY